MTRHISEEESDIWQDLANKWREASRILDEIELTIITELDGPLERRALDEVRRAQQAVGGNAYMFTPQPEWMGGDSADPRNFKIRPPHISK